MIDIKFEGNVDLSKFEINKEYGITFNYEDREVSINKALVKSIDIKNNSIKIEPLVEKGEEPTKCVEFTNHFSMKLIDKETGETVLG